MHICDDAASDPEELLTGGLSILAATAVQITGLFKIPSSNDILNAFEADFKIAGYIAREVYAHHHHKFLTIG